MSKKPSIPKGTRDFSPQEVTRRNYIMSTIRESFANFGFQPIETPSFENSDTLMGKYGEEGDRLIFKILNSGDYVKKLDQEFNFYNIFQYVVNRKYNELVKNVSNLKAETNKEDKTQVINEIEKLIAKQVSVISMNYNNRHLLAANNLCRKFLGESKALLSDILYDKVFNGINDRDSFIDGALFTYFKSSAMAKDITPKISEKALRYDLTVPFARYVVQHQNEITFPFKRYQIQPVWRADRPQKGRFREFYQCDADVVGSKSLWQEVELVQLYDTVFTKLNLKATTIKINNRKILSGIAEVIGAEEKLIDFTVALDKLDKIGKEGVTKEMREKGISDQAIDKLEPLFTISGDASEKLNLLKNLLSTSEIGLAGVGELQFIVNNVSSLGLQTASLEIDVTLARGLNYYTGAIFEVAAPEGVDMGSIGGGGRYDDLTGIFGMKDISGVGISFGLDRIYLVIEQLGLFPETVSAATKVLFINFGEAEARYAMRAIQKLRQAGISAELYPDEAKMGKQMGYADKRDINFTILAGSKEISEERFTLKNMKTGEQEATDLAGLIKTLA